MIFISAPMGLGDTPNSPNVAAAPSTPSGANQDGSSAQQGQTTQQQQQQQQPQQQQIQQQQQQMQPQQPPAPTQPKEINTVMVCKIGLETVQEIVNRTHEIFNYLKALQPPFGSQNLDKVYVEKQHRLNEVLGGITQHFKRLRVCWEKANVSLVDKIMYLDLIRDANDSLLFLGTYLWNGIHSIRILDPFQG